MFLNDWSNVWRTLVVGVLAYIALVLFLRISGKRTLTKMNAYDLIVTIALGSTLATILLTKDVALVEGLTAYAVLIGMQYIIAWLSIHSKTVQGLVKSSPALVYYKGYCRDTMRRERVQEIDILQAVRSSGFNDVEKVDAVVLETDGSFSVIKKADDGVKLEP